MSAMHARNEKIIIDHQVIRLISNAWHMLGQYNTNEMILMFRDVISTSLRSVQGLP